MERLLGIMALAIASCLLGILFAILADLILGSFVLERPFWHKGRVLGRDEAMSPTRIDGSCTNEKTGALATYYGSSESSFEEATIGYNWHPSVLGSAITFDGSYTPEDRVEGMVMVISTVECHELTHAAGEIDTAGHPVGWNDYIVENVLEPTVYEDSVWGV